MNSYDMSRTSRLTAERPGQVPPSRHPGGASAWAAERRLGCQRSQPRARSSARIMYSRRQAERWVRMITWPGPTVPPAGLFIASSSRMGHG